MRGIRGAAELMRRSPAALRLAAAQAWWWECDPFTPWVEGPCAGRSLPVPGGRFAHEAVCVADPPARAVPSPEDASVPAPARAGALLSLRLRRCRLSAGADRPRMEQGRLQVLQVRGLPANTEVVAAAATAGLDLAQPVAVDWVRRAASGNDRAVRLWSRPAMGLSLPAPTSPSEGTGNFNGTVYFATQFNNRIWAHDTVHQTLEVIYDGSGNANAPGHRCRAQPARQHHHHCPRRSSPPRTAATCAPVVRADRSSGDRAVGGARCRWFHRPQAVARWNAPCTSVRSAYHWGGPRMA